MPFTFSVGGSILLRLKCSIHQGLNDATDAKILVPCRFIFLMGSSSVHLTASLIYRQIFLDFLQVALATNAGPIAFDRMFAFEEVFKRRNIKMLKKVMFDANATAQEMIASGLLDELRSSARGLFFIIFEKRRRWLKRATGQDGARGPADHAHIISTCSDSAVRDNFFLKTFG